MKISESVRELVGNTPLLNLKKLSSKYGANIFGKCEFMNPNSSVKDRIALNMIEVALKEGKINKETILIEPTSGNTGIGLASICASYGIKLILTMPSSMSIERRKLLLMLGAKIELTPSEKGMNGAVDRANELLKEIPNSYILQQFENIHNPEAHAKTTALEILDSLKIVDAFIAGIGTGGTITGVGKVLKEHNPNIKIFALEPKSSPVLSGGKPGSHKIQGIGAGFIPKVLDTKIYDEIIQVGNEEAISFARNIAREEGILIGISSGANLCGASIIAKEFQGKNIVTILCDTAERYLSTDLFNFEA